VFQR
jgi:hypothetical protein